MLFTSYAQENPRSPCLSSTTLLPETRRCPPPQHKCFNCTTFFIQHQRPVLDSRQIQCQTLDHEQPQLLHAMLFMAAEIRLVSVLPAAILLGICYAKWTRPGHAGTRLQASIQGSWFLLVKGLVLFFNSHLQKLDPFVSSMIKFWLDSKRQPKVSGSYWLRSRVGNLLTLSSAKVEPVCIVNDQVVARVNPRSMLPTGQRARIVV
mmetsp:Transcript_1717/g.2716  ORF Transcript_1717/g.2716 Transcript_1717/m.2716 type:complete len:205 (-) Transcript_1717:1089-1703(-)